MIRIFLLIGIILFLYIIHSKINHEYHFIRNVIKIALIVFSAIFLMILISAIMGNSLNLF